MSLVDEVLQLAGDHDILIGGQALAHWATYFQVPKPAALEHAVTYDIDLLTDRYGAVGFIERLSKRFGVRTKARLATLDDSTVNVAKAVVDDVEIDLLSSVYGDPRRQVQAQAIPAAGLLLDDRLLHLMHPVDCLRTRVWNLSLPSKNAPARLQKSLDQVELAISVVRAYLSLVADPRKQLKFVEQVIELANSRLGRRARQDYQVDPLRAIPVEAIRSVSFQTHRWPRVQAHFAERYGDARRAAAPAGGDPSTDAAASTGQRPR